MAIMPISWKEIGTAGRLGVLAAPYVFVSLLLLLLVGSLFFPMPPPVGGNILEANLPLLSEGHLLGTDMNGNDTGSRLLSGGRTSLMIALAANALGLLCGGFIGASSALRGGAIDAVVMRLIDTFL